MRLLSRLALAFSLVVLSNCATFGSGCTSKPKVCVFAGHVAKLRGNDNGPGANSSSGVSEYVFNDKVVRQFEQIQNSGIEYVVYKATEDIPYQERPELADNQNCQVYIEVHHDALLRKSLKTKSEYRSISGFSIWYSVRNPYPDKSRELAIKIGEEFLNQRFFPRKSYATWDHARVDLLDEGVFTRVENFDNLHVLIKPNMPAILIEVGVIQNPYAEEQLRNPRVQKQVVDAIDKAVTNYFNRLDNSN